MLTRFILYACPTGAFADQIDHYFAQAGQTIGHNPAHDYMPHISLTGFFPDKPTTAPEYSKVLDRCFKMHLPMQPMPVVVITAVRFDERFHGLEISAPWLKTVTAAFAVQATSATRPEAIRCKEWLHLSFAYGFPAEQHEPLRQLASQLIDPNAPAGWEMRFYEQRMATEHHDWICHHRWPLPMGSS